MTANELARRRRALPPATNGVEERLDLLLTLIEGGLAGSRAMGELVYIQTGGDVLRVKTGRRR